MAELPCIGHTTGCHCRRPPPFRSRFLPFSGPGGLPRRLDRPCGDCPTASRAVGRAVLFAIYRANGEPDAGKKFLRFHGFEIENVVECLLRARDSGGSIMGRRERKPGPAEGNLRDGSRAERIALLEGVYEEHRDALLQRAAELVGERTVANVGMS